MTNKSDPNFIASELTRENALLKSLLSSALANIIEQEKIGKVFHDFNNILSSLMGYSSLATERVKPFDDEKLLRYLGNIERSGIRARDLVRERLDHRQQERVKNRCCLNDVVKNALPNADLEGVSEQFWVHMDDRWLSLLLICLSNTKHNVSGITKVLACELDADDVKAGAAEFAGRQLELTIIDPQIKKNEMDDLALAEAILLANGGQLCHSLVQDGQIVIYLRSAADKVLDNS